MALSKIDVANMLTGVAPLANGGTGATSFTAGITMADAWRITANYEKGSSGGSYLTSNWERIDTDGFGQIGTGLSNSSGEFTFPSTGVYFIHFQAYCDGQNGASTYAGICYL